MQPHAAAQHEIEKIIKERKTHDGLQKVYETVFYAAGKMHGLGG
jgi:hypothetical protein